MAIAANWSDLPPELLDLVANGFDCEAPSDTLHFRSVCGSWRSAVAPRQPLNSILQFPAIRFFSSSDHLHVAKHTFFHLSHVSGGRGWLIKMEEHKPGVFHLFINPFSRTRTPLLVPNNNNNNNKLDLFPAYNKLTTLDLSNVNIYELGHEYVLRNLLNNNGDDGSMGLYNMEHQKVALKFLNSDQYVILATHNTGKLLMYRPHIKLEWEFLDDFTLGYDDRSIFVNDWSLHYVDVAEYEGRFYAVTNSGRTVAIEEEEEEEDSVTVTLLMKSMIGGDKKCLVKSGDDLLMVDLYTLSCPEDRGVGGLVKPHAVEIFKLDKQKQTWVLLESLGERSLFLSNHSSFSASLPGCKPNCIYFHFKNLDKQEDFCCCDHTNQQGDDDDDDVDDDDVRDHFGNSRSDEIGVFDFQKGIVGSLEDYLQDLQLFSWTPPDWVTPSA